MKTSTILKTILQLLMLFFWFLNKDYKLICDSVQLFISSNDYIFVVHLKFIEVILGCENSLKSLSDESARESVQE